MNLFLHRTLALALWLIPAARWSHAQETLFPDTWLSKASQGEYLDVEPSAGFAPELQFPTSLMATVRGTNEGTLKPALAPYNLQVSQPPSVSLTPESAVASSGSETTDDAERFRGNFSNDSRRYDVGTDFYSPPEFEGGLIVFGKDVAMKIGGYVKADFIYDFNPINSTDLFNTTAIPVGAPPRTEPLSGPDRPTLPRESDSSAQTISESALENCTTSRGRVKSAVATCVDTNAAGASSFVHLLLRCTHACSLTDICPPSVSFMNPGSIGAMRPATSRSAGNQTVVGGKIYKIEMAKSNP